MADVEFFFDPACPFCWVTSKWVREVQSERDLDVRWRFVSLRMLNDEESYEDKPPQYPAEHQQGLEMLRVCAAVRDEHGAEILGELYREMGEAVWERREPAGTEFEDILEDVAAGRDIEVILERVGLPIRHATAVHDDQWDEAIRVDTEEALERAGGDVGTPVLSFDPPDGPAFFGPVISDPPRGREAVELWDAVTMLAEWEGFAELKRALRDFPQVRLADELDDPEAREAS